MKQAVIDIGSNSMRLTVYETTETGGFTILFKDKVMAGLAGYVEDGALSLDGIARAVLGLMSFRNTLEALNITQVSVFATASLRNITNTTQAVSTIQRATGFSIEVISGEEEARYGYAGAMEELDLSDGLFVDIGGASTEVVRFADRQLITANSCPVGSLKLYRDWVKKILPNREAIQNMEHAIQQAMEGVIHQSVPQGLPLVCVGGTSRAALKLAKRVCHLPESANRISIQQLQQVCAALCASQKAAADLILKVEPERIHTMIPGLLILRHIVEWLWRRGNDCQPIRRKRGLFMSKDSKGVLTDYSYTPKPRTQLAALQSPGPGGGGRRHRPHPGAVEVYLHFYQQPGRVFHGPGGEFGGYGLRLPQGRGQQERHGAQGAAGGHPRGGPRPH